ncbi:hypothetical protein GW17_00014561 [Ensete ventricosum]|nr:hypothetical protein GW17_00014561 [Ensete ventricosum]RZR90858.1 hypothetical protein BHM03_00018837 [Ensete ventricosum]
MDLIVDPNLPVAITEEQAVPQQTTSVTDDGGNSSASDISGQKKVSQVAPDANPLVSALGQLSVSEPAAKENISTVSVSGIDSSPKASGGENLPTTQQEQLSLLKSTGSPSNQPSDVPAVGTSNDQDLFTSLYPTAPLSAPGWQRGPYPGIGYNMQFPTRVVYTAPTYTQTSKFVNPFDLTSDPDPTFPSVTSQHVPLPNMTSPLALIRTSSFGAPSPRWNLSEHLPNPTSVSPGKNM